MQLMVPESLIKNSKYEFIRNNLLTAVMYGAPLQGNFPYALKSLNESFKIAKSCKRPFV